MNEEALAHWGVVAPKIKYEQVTDFCEYGMHFEAGVCFLWTFIMSNNVLRMKYVKGQLRRIQWKETAVGDHRLFLINNSNTCLEMRRQ